MNHFWFRNPICLNSDDRVRAFSGSTEYPSIDPYASALGRVGPPSSR